MQDPFPSSFSKEKGRCCSCRPIPVPIHLFLLLQVAHQGVSLRRLSLDLALAGRLGLRTLGVHLLLQLSLAGLLSLGAVDL